MDWSRRIVMGSGLATMAWATVPSWASAADGPDPLASTGHGRLRGARERGVCVFRGVPYGGTVSGAARRFKAPPPAPSWTGIRDATAFGAPAMHPPGGQPGAEPAPAEDCLFLNIWTPAADGAKRPVMFYNHGGGFTVGFGSRAGQNGANLAREHDVVVVESNHRLGIFGYLYLGELLGPEFAGNQGLLDLVAALRWVADNIAAFGGDPDNVMIFGESGGGGKTAALYTMPFAAPYFNKASIESAIGPRARSPAEATDVAREAMKALGLTDPRRLLDIPAEQLLRFQTGDDIPRAPGTGPRGQRNRDQMFWPVIDGRILPEVPFATQAPAISATKPLIVGSCKDEAVFFNFGDESAFALDAAGLQARLRETLGARAQRWIDTFRRTRPGASPSQLYMAITTATPWREHAIDLAEAKVREGRAPVYAYLLDYRSPTPVPGTTYPMGSPHASDIVTKFGNVRRDATTVGNSPFTADQSEAHFQTAEAMSSMWAAFARTGVPDAKGQPVWRPYTLDRRETMIIDAKCRMVNDPEATEREFWQRERGTRDQ